MRHINPKFSDLRVCGICGAPAEMLGNAFTRSDGTEDFFKRPVELKCDKHVQGAERREVKVGEGARKEIREKFVKVVTHCCIRGCNEDATGEVSDAKEHAYECGGLMISQTRRVDESKLDPRCFVEVPHVDA